METRGDVGASHNSVVHNLMKRQVVVNIQNIKMIRIKRLDVRLNGPVEKLMRRNLNRIRSRENVKSFLSSHFIVVNNERIIIQKRSYVPLQIISDGKHVIRDIGISSAPEEVKEKVINVRKVVRLTFFSEDVPSIVDVLQPNNWVGVLQSQEDTRREAQVHSSKKEIELKYFTDGEYDMVDLDEFRHCEIIDLTSDHEDEAEVLKGNVDENKEKTRVEDGRINACDNSRIRSQKRKNEDYNNNKFESKKKLDCTLNDAGVIEEDCSSICGGKISKSENAHGLHTDFHLRKVPAWAEEKALKRSLRISEKVVPESIFAEPSPPNLQDIFPSTSTSRGDLYRSPVRPLSDLMKIPNQQPSSLFSKPKGM